VKKIITVLVSVAALLLPPVSSVSAHASTPPDHTAVAGTTGVTYQLVDYNSGKCAGLYGTSTSDNAVFTQYPCGTPGFHDQWSFIFNFSGDVDTWYQLQNAYSGKCAQSPNFSKTVGGDIVQVTCLPLASGPSSCSNSCAAQLWRIDASSRDGYYGYNYYHNRYTTLCLNAGGGGTTGDGTHITQTNCGSSHYSDEWCLNGSLYCRPGVMRPFG